MYTEHLTAAWRHGHPAGSTPTLVVDDSVSPELTAPMPRVAAICHVFYPDLLDALVEVLANLPPDADVFASVVSERHRSLVVERLTRLPLGRFEVRVVPNRGRDIAPKYVAFDDVYGRGYDLLLFLHTKKTTSTEIGEGWREYLYSTLGGTADRVRSVLATFSSDPDLGVLAPDHFGSIASNLGWHGSFPHAAAIADRAGFDVRRWDPPDFPSGSMFWARPEALRPLTRLGLQAEEFPREAGQNAYTIMHALERLVFVSAGSAGYSSAFMTNEVPSSSILTMPSTHERPSPGMRIRAVVPTISEIASEAWLRRKKFRPARIRAWVSGVLRAT